MEAVRKNHKNVAGAGEVDGARMRTDGEIAKIATSLRAEVVDIKHLRHTAYIVFHNMQARPTHAEAFLEKMQHKWRRVVTQAKAGDMDGCADGDIAAVLSLLENDFVTACRADTWIGATMVALDPVTYAAQRWGLHACEKTGFSTFGAFEAAFWNKFGRGVDKSSSGGSSSNNAAAGDASSAAQSGTGMGERSPRKNKPKWVLTAILRFHLRSLYRVLPDVPAKWRRDSVLIGQWCECLMMERGSTFGMYHYMTLGEYSEMRHKQRQRRAAAATAQEQDVDTADVSEASQNDHEVQGSYPYYDMVSHFHHSHPSQKFPLNFVNFSFCEEAREAGAAQGTQAAANSAGPPYFGAPS